MVKSRNPARTRTKDILTFVCVLVLGVTALYYEGVSLRAIVGTTAPSNSSDPKKPKYAYRPLFKDSFYRFTSFGQTQTAVDWFIIRSTADDDLSWVSPDQKSDTYYQYDLMTSLDPLYLPLYVYGANYLTVARNDNGGALEITKKGRSFMESSVPYLPESVRKKYWGTGWRIYLIEGYLRLFEFQDITGALEVYSWLEGMSDLPLSLTRIATAIKTARGRIRIGLNSVQAMLASVRPDLDKRKLYDFQKRLMTSDLLLNLNQDWRSFLKSRNPKKSTALWGEFKRLNQVPSEDPLGGEIYLNSEGKIWTKSDWKPLVQEDKEF